MGVAKDLPVDKVDFKSRENAEFHHTERFELLEIEPLRPVLRRGQPFTIKVHLKHYQYDPEYHDILAVFSLGPAPDVRNGTKGLAKVDNKKKDFADKPIKWEAIAKDVQIDSILLEVRSPCDAPIGFWSFELQTNQKGSVRRHIYTYPEGIYMLFNPWMKDDQVYMSETKLLDEYVLNDVGKIWGGSYKDPRGRHWAYAQFDDIVLPACMLILKRSNVRHHELGDAVKVARVISKLVNVQDGDRGVIYGNWGNKYEGGTPPTEWTGTVPILEKYLRTDDGVKYGQCWVYAGVVTTVCRALGIPCRPVSNMESAHDTNNSLTIDYYYNEDNKPIKNDSLPGGMDMIWNFHVWNDVWMARPDLPKGYGGWQAIDATPQEKSDGYYQCGPAPLEAIRTGATGFSYDVPFIISEVNADVMYWKIDPGSVLGYKKIECDKCGVGRCILTKRPGTIDYYGESDREDITMQYKQNEDSPEERLCLYNAARGNRLAKRLYSLISETETDVLIALEDMETVPLGQKFEVKVKFVNKSDEDRHIQTSLTVESVYYNGMKGDQIKKEDGIYTVKAKTSVFLRLQVTPEDYSDKLVEQNIVRIKAIACVEETKHVWAADDNFQIKNPRINIKVPATIKANLPVTASFNFKNPLKKNLTYCKLNIHTPGLIKPRSFKLSDVNPLEEMSMEYTFVPIKTGSFTLVSTFNSMELTDVVGSVHIKCIKE